MSRIRAFAGPMRLGSIRNKLALPFALVIGAISLFVYWYFPAKMEDREIEALRARGESIAEMLASNAQVAVTFDNREDLNEVLHGALTSPEVAHVEAVLSGGEVIGQATADGFEPNHPDAAGRAVELVWGYAPVIELDQTIAEVRVVMNPAGLQQGVAAARTTVQLIAGAIFLGGVLALWFLSRIVTRPLFGIVSTSERIAAGDLTQRAPVTTDDEVGQLATSFNAMLDRLQSTQRELEHMNRSLEQRVEERTREWQQEQEQRIRAEAEKTQVERLYEQVLDALPLEISVFDLEQRILYVNPASVDQPEERLEIVGKTPRESGSAERVGEDVSGRREAAVREAIETGCLVSLEEHIDTRQAEDRHFIRVYSPMLSPDGDVDKVVGYGVDITGRRNAEEALRASEEKLQQSQKMEAVGRLAGGIAHDFNNLLTVITGHAELLMMSMDEDDPDFEELDQMKRAAERAATLTRQLLAFSRRQVLQPRHVDPNTIVSDVEKMLRRLIGEHIELTTVLTPGIGSVKADPGQLEQVLMNLAVNARDAMPTGGTLSIESSSIEQKDAVARWSDHLDPGTYCLIVVRDTGCGMPEHVQEKVFEPFFTTKDVGKGTGLGLATVYGIVKQSGGFVYVESSVGHGTEFRVFLPQEGPEEGEDTPLQSVGPAANGVETILLVEDEPMVRDLARRILERGGYDVLIAPGGQEALDILHGHEGRIDLLFTDVVMPGIPGNELATLAKEIRPGLRVLLMSGYTDDTLLGRGALEDGIVLLQKPFTPDRVTQVVRRVLDGETLPAIQRASAALD